MNVNGVSSAMGVSSAVFFDSSSLTAEYAVVMKYSTQTIWAKLENSTLSWYFTTTDTSVTSSDASEAQANMSGVKYYWAALF